MNCQIKTRKKDIIVHTYRGLNNFIVKVYTIIDDKQPKLDGIIVNTWIEAVDKHRFYCGKYLLEEKDLK